MKTMKRNIQSTVVALIYCVTLWMLQRGLFVAILWSVQKREAVHQTAVVVLFLCITTVVMNVLPRRFSAAIANGYAAYAASVCVYAIFAYPSMTEYAIANLVAPFKLALLSTAAVLYVIVGLQRFFAWRAEVGIPSV